MSDPTPGRPATSTPEAPTHFIRNIVRRDVAAGKHGGQVVTRFPPEPNGYLHIGHAKSIFLNFGIAAEFDGRTHLRYDDTNPAKEEQKYIDAIEQDLAWLGCSWSHLRHASDYFEVLYRCARKLIRQGDAYVCDQSADEVRAARGTLTEPGRNSPWRNRTVEENLDLFARMRAGEFADGSRTLRARIDMTAANINLRDPAIYRIRRLLHPRTGDAWCIYPMYDFAHGISDALEGITHSLCTLEFEDHRPLYDWFLDRLDIPNDPELTAPLSATGLWLPPSRPQQIEFARLNLDYTVLSKRRLNELVNGGHVEGWDDPRLPTLAGFRRRGYTPEALRAFCELIGISKQESVIPMEVLENTLRDDLNRRAQRRMAVLRPLKVVLVNYPEGQSETVDAANHPQDESLGTRQVPFDRELYIEQDDFSRAAPPGFHRLKPGGEVRLRNAYIIRCEKVIAGRDGDIAELHCTYDPASKSGLPGAARKVKGTIHWVSARHALDAEVRLYDRLFTVPHPTADKSRDFKEFLNPESLVTLTGAKLEPALTAAAQGEALQFERQGYFTPDCDSAAGRPVFNRAVSLRDTWANRAKS